MTDCEQDFQVVNDKCVAAAALGRGDALSGFYRRLIDNHPLANIAFLMMLLGGLIMPSRGGGLYYLFCGVGSAAVGWLLMQCSRWAMVLHGVLLLAALAWAWQIAKGSLGLAVVQAAPVWIAALWLAVRAVREPLE